MKDLTETLITYALALAGLIIIYNLYAAQLQVLITQAFEQLPH